MTFFYDIDNEYGARFIGDGGEDGATLRIQRGATTQPSVLVESKVGITGNASIAPLRIAGQSAASAAALGFRSAISLTSIVLTTVANFDYAIPIEINGEARYIPVLKAAGLVGAAAHS